MSRYAI